MDFFGVGILFFWIFLMMLVIVENWILFGGTELQA
jgi:hypothetical protein